MHKKQVYCEKTYLSPSLAFISCPFTLIILGISCFISDDVYFMAFNISPLPPAENELACLLVVKSHIFVRLLKAAVFLSVKNGERDLFLLDF